MGLFDAVAVLLLLLSPLMPAKAILYGSGYLISKGSLFAIAGNFVSWFDVAAGLYLLLVAFGIGSTVITVLVFIYLLQKALFSFI